MMTPLLGAPGLGVPELLIILAVVLILFGGSRLAGLGKSTGRALREFKEETKGLAGDKDAPKDTDPAAPTVQNPQLQGHQTGGPVDGVTGEIVEPTTHDMPRSESSPETRRDA